MWNNSGKVTIRTMTTPMIRMPLVEPISDTSPTIGVGVVVCLMPAAAPASCSAETADVLKFVNASRRIKAVSKVIRMPKLEMPFIVLTFIHCIMLREGASPCGVYLISL